LKFRVLISFYKTERNYQNNEFFRMCNDGYLSLARMAG